MLISAVKITDPQKKDELIHFANALGCKAVNSQEYGGMAIEIINTKAIKRIQQKIEELQQ